MAQVLTWVGTFVLAVAYAWTLLAWPVLWLRLVIGTVFAGFWFAVFWAGYMDPVWASVTVALLAAGSLFILAKRSDRKSPSTGR